MNLNFEFKHIKSDHDGDGAGKVSLTRSYMNFHFICFHWRVVRVCQVYKYGLGSGYRNMQSSHK